MLKEKVLCISIIGILAVGLSGCGCLGCLSGCGCMRGGGCVFPSTSNTLDNLHVALYREADDLLHKGEYTAAVKKYEQAFKIRPRRTKVIDVSYVAQLKYRIALCYAKLAEAEDEVSLYLKAEAAVRESYQTAILQDEQIHSLYLWGYILFKQARYEEARAKYEEAIEIFLPEGESSSVILALYTLGIVYLELGNEVSARQVFAQFLRSLETSWMVRNPVGIKVLYRLGKAYMELGDEAAAQRAYTQLEREIDDNLQRGLPYIADELFWLGKAYMELSDEAAAQRVFAQLETLDPVGYNIMYRLGQAYMELGDEAAAQRVLAQLEREIDATLQSSDPYIADEYPYIADELYWLGKAYMEHGDEANARRIFTQLLEHYPYMLYHDEVERLLEKL